MIVVAEIECARARHVLKERMFSSQGFFLLGVFFLVVGTTPALLAGLASFTVAAGFRFLSVPMARRAVTAANARYTWLLGGSGQLPRK